MMFQLNEDGYLCDWLVSGAFSSDAPAAKTRAQNEMPLTNGFVFWREDEQANAAAMYDGSGAFTVPAQICEGAEGLPGCPWTYRRCGEENLVSDTIDYRPLKKTVCTAARTSCCTKPGTSC